MRLSRVQLRQKTGQKVRLPSWYGALLQLVQLGLCNALYTPMPNTWLTTLNLNIFYVLVYWEQTTTAEIVVDSW